MHRRVDGLPRGTVCGKSARTGLRGEGLAGNAASPHYPGKLRQISERARTDKGLQFTSLAHLITVDLLEESFYELNRKGAAGVDGVTWREYEVGLGERLQELHMQLKQGQYRAQPVRRVYIEKDGGKLRPLGVPALVDKIVQKAAVTVLESIYEQDFYDFSYGFRPGRSAQQALDVLNDMCYRGEVAWIIDADIRGYFDSVVHAHLREFIQKRVVDTNMVRLLGKWLKAGVIDDGRLLPTQMGTPQGGVASPLLANIYLHYVLDEWFMQEVLPRMRGAARIVRYADDFVLGFARREDAERVLSVLIQRFLKYGLELHPTKTQLIPFSKWEATRMSKRRTRLPTFNFLGFTHFFGLSRKGNLVYRVRTMSKRLSRFLRGAAEWCRTNRHTPVPYQRDQLTAKLRGHYNYYGRGGNYRRLHQAYNGVVRLWFKWLGRRHGRKPLAWKQYYLLLSKLPLPPPYIARPFQPATP